MQEKPNELCPVCDSAQTYRIINWNEYSIRHCKKCILMYAHPFPTEEFLNEFYQGFLFNIPEKKEVRQQIDNRKSELNRLFDFNTEKGMFLDNGGGTGSAYKAASELNLSSYYHDLDKEAETFVINEHGLKPEFIIDNVKNSTIHFDYIFSDNVIEHLLDPIDYVKEMREVLNKDGQIIIKTPHGKNTELFFYPLITIREYFLKAIKYNSLLKSLQAYFKRFWHCDPPRHVYSFSDKNLRIIGRKAGFKESEIEVLYYRLPLFQYSLTSAVFNFKKRHSLKTILLRIIVLPIVALEIFTKVVQYVLVKIKVLTPGGIILKLKKLD